MGSKDPKSIEIRVSGQIPEPGRRLLPLVKQTLRCNDPTAKRTMQSGGVAINGRVQLRSDWIVEPGDRLSILRWTPEPPKKETTKFSDRRIIYQDDLILVVEKPAGILTVPTPYREKNTLIHWLEKEIAPDLVRNGDGPPGKLQGIVFSIHRLDRDVSGLLVFAKNLKVAEQMREQFSQRKPQRRYTAIVAGIVGPDQGTFRSYLATDKNLNRYSVPNESDGELAITHYRVESRWRDSTLVTVELETGRRNQIRVHFAEANHPVLGETRYRRHQAEHDRWRYRRIALHAHELGFEHPGTGKFHLYHSSLPNEFESFRRAMS